MAINIAVTGKCVNCPGLDPDLSTLYADGEPKEWFVTCKNSKLCDHIEKYLDMNKRISDPFYDPFNKTGGLY